MPWADALNMLDEHQVTPPPSGRVEGKYKVNFWGILPDAGSIAGGIHFWEVPFALMLSPGWRGLTPRSYFSSSPVLLSSLELSDTQVYGP